MVVGTYQFSKAVFSKQIHVHHLNSNDIDTQLSLQLTLSITSIHFLGLLRHLKLIYLTCIYLWFFSVCPSLLSLRRTQHRLVSLFFKPQEKEDFYCSNEHYFLEDNDKNYTKPD